MSLIDALLLDPAVFHVWFAVREGIGSGTITDPYGNAQFDPIMRELYSDEVQTVVHLGPGLFETQGFYDGADSNYGMRLGPRTRLMGAGIDVTTLKLVTPSGQNSTDSHFYAVGHPLSGLLDDPRPSNYAEVCDLTIDANAQQSGVTAGRRGGVRLMGDHVRVRRVKVINWGTKSSSKPAYGITLVTADPTLGISTTDAGMEDCALLSPVVTDGPAVGLYAGPNNGAADLRFWESSGYSTFIRNCYVEFPLSSGSIQTNYQHRGIGFAWGIGGVIEGNQIYNVRNGMYFLQEGSITDVVVRNNYLRNVIEGIYWNPNSGVLAGSPVAAVTNSAAYVTFSSNYDPKLSVGDRVKIVGTGYSALDGLHTIETLGLVGTQVRFTFSTSAGNTGASYGVTVSKMFVSGNPIVEGNVVELSPESGLTGIQFSDGGLALDATYPAFIHDNVLLRNNKIRYVGSVAGGSYNGIAAKVHGAKTLMVQSNVLEVDPVNPLRNSRSWAVTYFNNKTPAGELKQGYNEATSKHYGELETEAEDALFLSLFKRK